MNVSLLLHKSILGLALFLLSALVVLSVPTSWAAAQTAASNNTLPIAVTVSVLGSNGGGGELVVYDEGREQYSLTQAANEAGVIGVTAVDPPVLFSTQENGVPVITGGTGYVRVNSSAGPIRRGDLLVSSAQAGVAAKALPDNDEVFAMALEDMTRADDSAVLILAQIDPQGMKAVLAQREKEAEEAETEGLFGGLQNGSDAADKDERGLIRSILEDYTRAVVAAVIVLGTLFFLVYTFQKTVTNATLSVGRNPRARSAIMMVSVGNLVFTLIICAVALFVAIGVLVLPV